MFFANFRNARRFCCREVPGWDSDCGCFVLIVCILREISRCEATAGSHGRVAMMYVIYRVVEFAAFAPHWICASLSTDIGQILVLFELSASDSSGWPCVALTLFNLQSIVP
jgi:hypothetical protein